MGVAHAMLVPVAQYTCCGGATGPAPMVVMHFQVSALVQQPPEGLVTWV